MKETQRSQVTVQDQRMWSISFLAGQKSPFSLLSLRETYSLCLFVLHRETLRERREKRKWKWMRFLARKMREQQPNNQYEALLYNERWRGKSEGRCLKGLRATHDCPLIANVVDLFVFLGKDLFRCPIVLWLTKVHGYFYVQPL